MVETMVPNELQVRTEPLMVDVVKAAEICCVSPAKMKQWVKDGRVLSVKVDRCRRIRMDHLREFVAGLMPEAA